MIFSERMDGGLSSEIFDKVLNIALGYGGLPVGVKVQCHGVFHVKHERGNTALRGIRPCRLLFDNECYR